MFDNYFECGDAILIENPKRKELVRESVSEYCKVSSLKIEENKAEFIKILDKNIDCYLKTDEFKRLVFKNAYNEAIKFLTDFTGGPNYPINRNKILNILYIGKNYFPDESTPNYPNFGEAIKMIADTIDNMNEDNLFEICSINEIVDIFKNEIIASFWGGIKWAKK